MGRQNRAIFRLVGLVFLTLEVSGNDGLNFEIFA